MMPAFAIPQASATAPPAAAAPELVELEVRDVLPLVEAQTHAVVLSTKDGQTVLPIFVDESAALAIAFRLAHRSPPHPLSQDLLASVVEEMGGTVTEVRIDKVEENVFEGRVFIRQGEKQLSLDARPSDSIAMALGGEARIMTTPKVLSQAGISRKDIDQLREAPGVGGSGPPPDAAPEERSPDVQL